MVGSILMEAMGIMRQWAAALNRCFERSLLRVVIPWWSARDPVPLPSRTVGPALGDNVQQTMNLLMPLAHPGPRTTAELLALIQLRFDDIQGGLDTIGSVHFARFDIIDGHLGMFSVYDGDFETYIRDFIALFGHVFDKLMEYMVDPPPLPTAHHPSALVEWVRRHDLMQLPQNSTELSDLTNLPRHMLQIFHKQPNVQLGVYRGYSGVSAAQIRANLGLEAEARP